MDDSRFSHIVKDPKFRRVPKKHSKIKIDKRFKSMFTDKKFEIKYTTDKRGRPVKHHSKEDLERYYEVSSDESADSEKEVGRYVKAPKSEEKVNETQIGDLESKHHSDQGISESIKTKLKDLKVDYARGEQTLCSESSSDDEESDEDLDQEEIDHKWGELDGDAETTNEATYRLAACNLDWDRIRASDLMVLFNSFLPPGGIIYSVAIYPSEFGKQRMKEEDLKGPIELVELRHNEAKDETEEGTNYHMEKLRQYQLARLKYYYAVITFDSPSSANKIYSECDGLEYECSATKIDLRFVPDDLTFDDDPKELCDKLPEKYQPRFFTTTALQQAKVDLTWDETNPDRLEFTQKLNTGKIEDLSVSDLSNYLAGSSSEEEEQEQEQDESDEDKEEPKNVIEKYKALLQDISEKENNKKKDVELEISWGINLKEKTDKLLKNKTENGDDNTPFEKYLDKRKQKRKEKKERKKDDHTSEDSDVPSDIDMNDPYFTEEFQNSDFRKKKTRKQDSETLPREDTKAELDLLVADELDNKEHFTLKKIQERESESKSKKKKRQRKEESEDNFQINVKDKRFSALFTSHHYNIDPSDPHYKKTKAMETLISEKIKRKYEEVTEDKSITKPRSEKINTLVKSVMAKTKAYKNK